MEFKMILYIVGAIGALVLFWILMQNNAYAKHENVTRSWHQIDVLLTKRHEAIQQQLNLFGNVISSETKLGKDIAKYRSGINEYSSMGINEKIEFQNQMGNFLMRGLVQENYPELSLARDLQPTVMKEWNKTENEIVEFRKIYNNSATHFNIGLFTFPSSIFFKKARLLAGNTTERFKLFEASEQARQGVSVPQPNWGE